MIEICGLTKRYGAKTAVADLDLTIARGEVFAFLGPNGAGKTTSIKSMVGLLVPAAGSVTLDGIDVVKQPQDASRIVGYVPDEPYLYDKLTGREFLEFTVGMYGIEGAAAKECIEQQIAAFELRGFVDQLCESYSHGMKQRVVFASALVHQPRVLIVDEPMVGLDPKSMRFVKDLLRMEAAKGTTVFMSTHTLSVAEEIADRIGVIAHGRLKFVGTISDLRRQLERHDSTLETLFLEMTNEASESFVTQG